MGTEVPKQFLLLAGKPVLMHTILAFRRTYPDMQIVVVLPADQLDTWTDLCLKYQFDVPLDVVIGGSNRYQSVKNGLDAIAGEGLVAIHDGVRPLIIPETIRHLFTEAETHSNAIPTLTPKDSVRWDFEQGNRVIDRNFVKLIQTPQVFQLNKLKAAYVQEYDEAFTDDATVWEKAGNKVYLADGQVDNIKITGPEDLFIAEAIMKGRGQMAKGRN
jgi:2-C-methyl-D-erythritol 4-phosphate cytidylyltransferase